MLINLTECSDPYIVDPYRRKKEKRLKPDATKSEFRTHFRRKARRQRKQAEIDVLRANGGTTYTYAVGCGRCETCSQERQKKQQNRWFYRLSGMIQEFKQSGFSVWRKGVEKYFLSGQVYFLTFTFSNQRYPGASWCKRLSNQDISRLNKDYRFRSRSLREARLRFHKMLHNSKYNDIGYPYVVFQEFGVQNTRRVHLHAFFFAPGSTSVTKPVVYGMMDWWRKNTLTDQGDVQLITDDYMAANYITKYVLKTGAFQHRIMSSQFNWSNYEYKFRLDSHGLPVKLKKSKTASGYDIYELAGGSKKWHVLEEKLPLSVISESEDCLQGLQSYLDGLSEKGVLELPNLTVKPLGGIGCVEKCDNILNKALATTHGLGVGCSLRLVPHSRRRLQVQEARRVINRLSRLPRIIERVLLEACTRLGLGQELLCRVSDRVWSWYRMRCMVLEAPHP